jgi:hypothetical protein
MAIKFLTDKKKVIEALPSPDSAKERIIANTVNLNDNYLDIGGCLALLKDRGQTWYLGHASWAGMVRNEFPDIPVSRANSLVAIWRALSQEGITVTWEQIKHIPYSKLAIVIRSPYFVSEPDKWLLRAAQNTIKQLVEFVKSGGKSNQVTAPDYVNFNALLTRSENAEYETACCHMLPWVGTKREVLLFFVRFVNQHPGMFNTQPQAANSL